MNAGKASSRPRNGTEWIQNKRSRYATHVLQLFRELQSLHQLADRSTRAGCPRLRCCAIPASSSTTRDITGIRNTLFQALKFTDSRNCSARMISAIARYLGKSRPQPDDRALRNIPAEEHKNVLSRCRAVAPGRGPQPGPRQRCAARIRQGLSKARVS